MTRDIQEVLKSVWGYDHFRPMQEKVVRDVLAVQEQLQSRGVEIVRAAGLEPWGLHEMWLADPDGVPIVVVQVPEDHPLRRDSRK